MMISFGLFNDATRHPVPQEQTLCINIGDAPEAVGV
jgi:hypothetical protein